MVRSQVLYPAELRALCAERHALPTILIARRVALSVHAVHFVEAIFSGNVLVVITGCEGGSTTHCGSEPASCVADAAAHRGTAAARYITASTAHRGIKPASCAEVAATHRGSVAARCIATPTFQSSSMRQQVPHPFLPA